MQQDLSSLIRNAQRSDQQAMAVLLKKFDPLIEKYSYYLNYDDAKNDLTLAFIEGIHKIDLAAFQVGNDFTLLSYIEKTIIHAFYNLSKIQNQRLRHNIPYDDSIETPYEADHSTLELLDLIKNLTPLQKRVIVYKYIFGYTDIEIGKHFSISRQAVNGIKNRAFIQLKRELKER